MVFKVLKGSQCSWNLEDLKPEGTKRGQMGKQDPQDRAILRRGPCGNGCGGGASEGFKQTSHRLRAADLGSQEADFSESG